MAREMYRWHTEHSERQKARGSEVLVKGKEKTMEAVDT